MALTGGVISQGLTEAFNAGSRWYTAYPAIAPRMIVTERGGTLQVLAPSASNPGGGFEIEKQPGAAYTQASAAYTAVSFTTQPVGVEAAVDRAFRLPETALIDAATMCRRLADTAIEAIAANEALATSGAFPAQPASAVWTSPDSDPAADVMAAAGIIRAACGMYPNILAVSGSTWELLLGHPALRQRVAAVRDQGPRAVEDALGALLGVDRVVKSTVIANSAAVWPSATALLVVAAQPDDPPSEPSAMRMAYWAGEGVDESGWLVEQYEDVHTDSTYVRAKANLGLVLCSTALGCRITGITA